MNGLASAWHRSSTTWRAWKQRYPTNPAAEIVIVSDGCDQADILNYLQGRSKQPRFRVVYSQDNIGIPAALNLGIEACRHEWIARVDSDDITLPGRFLAQWDLMQSDPSIDVLGTALNYYIQQSNGIWVQPMQPACVALLAARSCRQRFSVF